MKIKALILAAGYGTRLYPLTLNKAKPLIQVGKKTIIDHLLEGLNTISDIDTIYVVTNNKFFKDLKEWAQQANNPKIMVLNDGTLDNEDRLGSIGDINFVIQKENLNDDLLVIAGDNLFGFKLRDFVNFFKEKNTSILAFRDLQDIEKVKKRFGVGILKGDKVMDMEEKPEKPKSSLAATACYLFKAEDLQFVGKLVKENNSDAPGNLTVRIVRDSVLHAFVFEEHWFDIGSHENLTEARKIYEN